MKMCLIEDDTNLDISALWKESNIFRPLYKLQLGSVHKHLGGA